MAWKGRRRRPEWLGPEPTPGQPVRRSRPYIWVTWLTYILAGEGWCLWALWFKSNYRWAKEEDDFDTVEYAAEHTAVMQAAIAGLIEDGYQVWIEKQNKFKIKGDRADLAGTPDVVAVRGMEGRIVDAKSGKEKKADWWQVQIYKLAAPLDKFSPLRGLTKLTGAVQYPTKLVEVATTTPTVRKQILDLIRVASGSEQPRRVPSRHECRYCAITSEDCPDRIDDVEEEDAPADTNEF